MLPSLELGFLTIQLYPFFWGLAWAVGAWFIHEHIPAKFKVQNFFYLLSLFLISILGAKYIFDLSGGSFKFSSGLGFVFYGGLLAGGFYLILLHKLKIQWVHIVLIPMVVVLPLSHAIGRIGCFFAGCCFGINHFPLPLVEAFFLVGIFILQLTSLKKSSKQVLAQYCLAYGSLRLCLEVFRGDARGLWMGFPPSVWISLGLIYLGFFFTSRRSCSK